MFSTSLSTLANDKDSMLWARFGKDNFYTRIFIDRDGDLFQHVLHYMRTGHLSERIRHDTSLLKDLYIEAEYYCLQSLCQLLQRHIQHQKTKTALLRHSTFQGLHVLVRDFEQKKNMRMTSFHVHDVQGKTYFYASMLK